MLRCRRISAFLAVSLLLGTTGCVNWDERREQIALDRTFIEYFPEDAPAPESDKLRVAVKDLIDMRGYVTTAGSKYFARTRPPAEKDAASLRLARERNVAIVGKANLSEFAMGVSGVNDFFGTPRSPLAPGKRFIPGGSSSGSASAVAWNFADVSFGTDTAGSIRVPAACCGVVGLKTTFGLVPLDGVTPLSPDHLDTVGPLARNVDDLVAGMSLLQEDFPAKYRQAVAAKPRASQITIGRVYVDGTSPAVDKAIDDALRDAGFRVVVLGSDFREAWNQAQEYAERVAVVDSARTNAPYRNKPGVSARTKAAIRLGLLIPRKRYIEALEWKDDWQRILEQTFKKVDLIALPTMQTLPPPLPILGRSAVLEALVFSIQNTVAVNYAGNPAIAVPIPVRNRIIPFTSVQFIGPRLSEAQLVNAARIIEEREPFPYGQDETTNQQTAQR